MWVFLQNFFDAEDGAVTVDWVVLTAAVVGLGLALVGLLHSTSISMLDDLGVSLLARFFPG